jgi:transcriptional regulator
MYIPSHHRETDPGKLYDFIEAHSFGLLVSTLDGGPFATHLPFLLERREGRLLAHLARANPHWRGLDGQDVLAVFSGPHAYVSPTWYDAENVVPTWNYVAVHAYGTCRLVEAPDAVADLLARTVARYEQGMPRPWSLDQASDFFTRMARMVVGLRVDIGRLEGKWKLNQNHPAERREKVARALAASADPDAREIARLMEEALK